MTAPVKGLIFALALTLPVTAFAQGDAAYCQALTAKYQHFIARMESHNPSPGTVDANVAIDQCRNGNTAAGIPVLEQKLRDAKIELPRRG